MQYRNAKKPDAVTGPEPRSERLRLELLPAFEAAARHLSITEAARSLSLTQSAVSRQIQALEENLGTALFERGHRAIALTEAGHILLRAVDDSMTRLRDAQALLRASRATRQVSITCTPGFASLWLIPRLARFTSQHPQVDVRISATVSMMDLARHQIDVAVRFQPIARGKGRPLFEERVLPLCAPGLLRGAAALRRPADLAQQTLLAVDMPDGEAAMVDWEPWLTVMGLQGLRMKRSLRFTQYADAVAAAIAGQGVVIGRLPLLQSQIDDARLVPPFKSSAASSRAYFLEVAAAPPSKDVAAFVTWLRQESEAASPASGRPD